MIAFLLSGFLHILARMKAEDVHLSEVLFEFHHVGSYVRVIAIDARTNTEITMVGDPSVGERVLKNTAMRKLKYVIAKNYNKRNDGSIIV